MICKIIIVTIYLLSYGYDESGAIPLTMDGGNTSDINSYNFLVSVHIEVPGRMYGYYHQSRCGGSIISKTYVITAAHCVYGFDTKNIHVRIGSTYLFTEGQYQNITEKHTGPYNSTTKKDDIGLLHLEKSLTFNERVGSIIYPHPNFEKEYMLDDPFKALGFGKGENGSYALRAANMRIVKNAICQGFTADFGHRFCLQNENITISKDDEGSPLLYGNLLFGIVSLTGAPNKTDRCVMVKVYDYFGFIEKTMLKYP